MQCPDVLSVENTLKEMDIKYEKRTVEHEALYVDQLFIHDPDGYMVEICNCENLPVIPMSPLPASSVRSSSLEQKAENRSEISLVTMSVTTSPLYYPNKS